MTISTVLMNLRHATSADRTGNKIAATPAQSSTKAPSASQQPRSFVAALVKALSAFPV